MPAKKTAPKPAKTQKPVSAASRKSAAPAKAKKAASKTVKPVAPPVPRKAAAPAATPPAAPKPVAAVPVAPPRRADGPVTTFVQRNPRVIQPPVDPEDGDDSSLLSGPRNVQPYLVKRGEQYMNRGQLTHFRTILQAWKRDLMEEVDRTVSHMKDEAANFPDPNDRATQEEEFSLELRTRDRERKLIRKIEEAIKRIEDGSYGYCLETGEEIGIKRLEARPVATLSIEAQERRERREKQYGDRDDRYR